MRFLVTTFGFLLFASSLGASQNAIHYTTTAANVKYLFATAEPVLRLKSGDILDTNTLDCFGNGLKKPGDTLSMATGDNPLAGLFYVEGAEPGDTLAQLLHAAEEKCFSEGREMNMRAGTNYWVPLVP